MRITKTKKGSVWWGKFRVDPAGSATGNKMYQLNLKADYQAYKRDSSLKEQHVQMH